MPEKVPYGSVCFWLGTLSHLPASKPASPGTYFLSMLLCRLLNRKLALTLTGPHTETLAVKEQAGGSSCHSLSTQAADKARPRHTWSLLPRFTSTEPLSPSLARAAPQGAALWPVCLGALGFPPNSAALLGIRLSQEQAWTQRQAPFCSHVPQEALATAGHRPESSVTSCPQLHPCQPTCTAVPAAIATDAPTPSLPGQILPPHTHNFCPLPAALVCTGNSHTEAGALWEGTGSPHLQPYSAWPICAHLRRGQSSEQHKKEEENSTPTALPLASWDRQGVEVKT